MERTNGANTPGSNHHICPKKSTKKWQQWFTKTVSLQVLNLLGGSVNLL